MSSSIIFHAGESVVISTDRTQSGRRFHAEGTFMGYEHNIDAGIGIVKIQTGQTFTVPTENIHRKKEHNEMKLPEIKNVYFNCPVTVVMWKDGTKTIVRCSENDAYDPEKGLAMAIIKKMSGNDNSFHKIFKKWIPVV